MKVSKLKSLWQQLKKLPGGAYLYGRVLSQAIPYSGTVSPQIIEVVDGKVRVALKEKRKLKNHLNSIHAMALANLAELATGMVVNFSLTDKHRAILTEFNIKYLKKARGVIEATAEVDHTELKKIQTQKSIKVVGTLKESSGAVVAEVEAIWLIDVV